MPDDRKSLGHQGESLALSFLQANGFKILETNFRTKAAEIDIIARDNETLCFIEVKTRRSIKKGLPRESVTQSKQNKIILGASFYLKKNKLYESKVRFDVIEVLENDGNLEFNLIKNAFQTR
ncbi:MAG: YraN family protein [Desulfobacula sp.]|jgi:putative endonuclease